MRKDFGCHTGLGSARVYGMRGIHLCERRVESGERRAVVGERKIGYSVVIFLEKEPLKPWKLGRLGSKFSLKLTKKTPKPWNIPSKIVK